MSEAGFLLHDDGLADSARNNLRFRYRAFLVMALMLAACIAVDIANHGSFWSRLALTSTGVVAGIGLPWLIWHLRVPFAARVALPILFLSAVTLNGRDPREDLSSLATIPVVAFLLGWGIDVSLRQHTKLWSLAGRVLFSLIWIFFVWSSYTLVETKPELWLDIVNISLGVVVVWLPRESLVPEVYRLNAGTEPIVARGLRFAGGWLASRAGIAILIILPSVIYLDLLDLPPLLRSELALAKRAEKEPGPAGESETGDRILFWKREARALTEKDVVDRRIEVHAAGLNGTEEVIKAIEELRRDPRNGIALEELKCLSGGEVGSLTELEHLRADTPLFYIDRNASGDDRVTAGLLSSPEGKWSRRAELRPLTGSDVTRIEIEVRRATLAILANGILILLLLGGPSGGVPAAWWLAIILAGTNLSWVGESLGLGLERVRFVMWREYADHQAGAALFGVHTLLVFFVRLAEGLTSTTVAHAGIWVALCWPVRHGCAIQSNLRCFWIQFGKIAVLSLFLVGLYWGFVFMGSSGLPGWSFIWHFLFPLFLVASGAWWRHRRPPGVLLPTIGRVAAIALLLRGWVPLLLTWERNSSTPEGIGLWAGHAAVLFGLVASVLLIIALERGTFLSPPHVEGQVWLIGIAAIPFLENVLGEPLSRLIAESGLFLGTTVGWLVFASLIWVIGPVSSFIGEFLSRWRARGLGRIEALHHSLKNLARSIRTNDTVLPATLCQDLFSDLEIIQPQLWRHLNGGVFQRLIPASESASGEKLISHALAEMLGGVDSSLRLEEMRMEWKWAAFHGELDRWFAGGGDLLLVPASHDGELLGVFCAPDLPENRFLLRPAISRSLGRALATAILLSPPWIDPVTPIT